MSVGRSVGAGSESNLGPVCRLPHHHFRDQFVPPEPEPVRQDEVLIEAAREAGVQLVRGAAQLQPEAQNLRLPVRRSRETPQKHTDSYLCTFISGLYGHSEPF